MDGGIIRLKRPKLTQIFGFLIIVGIGLAVLGAYYLTIVPLIRSGGISNIAQLGAAFLGLTVVFDYVAGGVFGAGFILMLGDGTNE